MKLDRDFFTSPTGQVLLVGAVLLLGILAVRWQHQPRPAPALPAAKPAPTVALPKTLTREGARFTKPPAPPANASGPAPGPAPSALWIPTVTGSPTSTRTSSAPTR